LTQRQTVAIFGLDSSNQPDAARQRSKSPALKVGRGTSGTLAMNLKTLVFSLPIDDQAFEAWNDITSNKHEKGWKDVLHKLCDA
jgi:hypothetical protein